VRNLWRPALLRYFVEVFRSDGTSIPPVRTTEPLEDGSGLDVPGRPRVIHVPGHTAGEVVLLPGHGDPWTGDLTEAISGE